MPRDVTPAKLFPPKPQQAMQRGRLFAKLDGAPGRFWICGPGGSGKTFLAASWLEQRKYQPVWLQLDDDDIEPRALFHYLAAAFGRLVPKHAAGMAGLARAAPREDIGTFARAFARRLYQLVPPRTALALDHVEAIDGGVASNEALAAFVSEAPAGVPVLLMSRTELPAAFASLRAREAVAVIGWPDLRLTLEETRELVAARTATSEGERLHALADGWVAGVVLTSEWLDRRQAALPYPELQREALFDYFARELLDAVPSGFREFLLAVAHLPSMTAEAAAAVSANPDAAEILEELAHRNFFTLRLPQAKDCYRFHPLLRDFLLQQASHTVSEETLRLTRACAASALEATDPAAAADILRALKAWDRLEELLARRGDGLLAASWNRGLLACLADLPPDELNRRARLRLWKCRALIDIDPRETLAELEGTWEVLEGEGSSDGMYDAWCVAVDCCASTFDFRALEIWLPRFRRLRQRSPLVPDAVLARRVIASTYVALASWSPDAEDFGGWESEALELVRGEELPADARLVLGSTLVHAWTFMGTHTSLAAEVTQRLRQLAAGAGVTPRARLRWLGIDAMNGMRFDEDESLTATFQQVQQAQAIIVEFGLQKLGSTLLISIEVVANMMRGDSAAADRAYARMLALPPPWSAFEGNRRAFLTALRALHFNQPADALQPARQHADFEEKNGIAFGRIYGQYVLGLALHLNGRRAEALRAFAASKRLSIRYRSPGSLCWNLFGLALVALGAGNAERCARLLRAGLDIMVPLGHLRTFYLGREQLSRLLSVAFEHAIHAEYVRRVVSIRKLVPPAGAGDNAWPWALQVYTLGGFELRRDGKPLQFARKIPRKPLLVLKFLATRGRSVREESIVESLWPGETHAAGARAFATALHRLRRLIGEHCVLTCAGMVELNANCVWVDARAFEELYRDIERALPLYRGPLLPGEHVEAWSLEARERLRRRFIDGIDRLGAAAASQGDWKRARDLYHGALEIEPAAEQLHQGAIRCQVAMGLAGEAVVAYRRCERALRSTFGVPPSELTRRLMEQALRESANR